MVSNVGSRITILESIFFILRSRASFPKAKIIKSYGVPLTDGLSVELMCDIIRLTSSWFKKSNTVPLGKKYLIYS